MSILMLVVMAMVLVVVVVVVVGVSKGFRARGSSRRAGYLRSAGFK